MSNLEQQWEPVVLRKKQAVAPPPPSHTPGFKKLSALEKEDVEAPKTIKHSAAQQIQQARCKASLTQEQLAQKIGVKVAVLRELENGKAIPDRAVINRLNRALQTKIEL